MTSGSFMLLLIDRNLLIYCACDRIILTSRSESDNWWFHVTIVCPKYQHGS